MKLFKFNQSGDTIIEVVISITILSTALTIAYTLSTSALNTSEAANYRTEALALANSQVELIKNVIAPSGSLTAPYKTATPYCITFDQVQQTNWVQYCKAFDGHHANATNTIFSVADTYSTTATSQPVIDINVQWPDPKVISGSANLDIYYRP